MSTKPAAARDGATAEIFDAGIFESEDVGQMVVHHPGTGAPTTWVWQIAGPGHAATIAQADRITRKTLREATEKEQARVNNRKWKGDTKEPAELRRENAEFFAERVLGWSPVRINGDDYPFSRENVIAVLLNPKMGMLYAQVVDYFRTDESFMKRSAPIS